MIRFALLVSCAWFFGLAVAPVAGQSVESFEFSENISGFPCRVRMEMDSGARLSLQLSDYQNTWRLEVWISGTPTVFERFFDSDDLRDQRAFETAFPSVTIGSASFEFHNHELYEVIRAEVDDQTTALFEIRERHNVAAALNVMGGRFSINGLIDVSELGVAQSEFRACSYRALDIREGEPVEVDSRAEFRMLFERSFETWVSSLSRADSCRVVRMDESEIGDVIERAASAFYPGFFNRGTRSDYQDELNRQLPLLILSGSTDALANGCLMARDQVGMWRGLVDRAIEAAEDMD